VVLFRRIGRRGAALLFFALLDLIYGYAVLSSPRPPGSFYAWADTVLPLATWVACWWTVAAICLFFAFLTYDTTAFIAAIAIKVGWGGTALTGWISGHAPMGYVSAVIWLAFAAFVYLIAGGIPAGQRSGRRWPWTRSSDLY
jgi:hypothetical protein